jgi:hypothetical protein
MSSQAYDLRAQIKARLVDQVSGLESDAVIITRQHAILEAIDATISTVANGIAVWIRPMGATHADKRSGALLFDSSLIVSTYVRPVLIGDLDAQPEEEIHEDMMRAMHGYRLAIHSHAGRVNQRLQVARFFEVDDPEFLRRDTIVESEFLGVN